jgi:hypothetical protein
MGAYHTIPGKKHITEVWKKLITLPVKKLVDFYMLLIVATGYAGWRWDGTGVSLKTSLITF